VGRGEVSSAETKERTDDHREENESVPATRRRYSDGRVSRVRVINMTTACS